MAAGRAKAALECQTIALGSSPDLLALARAGAERNLAYFENPSRGLALLGLGAAVELTASGPERFAALSSAARRALEHLGSHGDCAQRPLAMGGFSFFDQRAADPVWREFPPARLIVPKMLWVKRAGEAFLTLVFRDKRERISLLRRVERLEKMAGMHAVASPLLNAYSLITRKGFAMPILSREATKGSASFSTAQPPFEGMERVGTKNRVHAPQDTLLSVNGAVRHFASEFSSASSSYSASQYVVEGGNRGYGAGFQGVNESDERERARWRTRVNAALELIARGELAKVVLARKKVCTLRDPLEPAAVLARVRDHRPACLNFWIAGAKSSFIGSTPELLLRLRARRFVCGALAGSAARASDATRDRAQARALLASAKNAYEHQLVVAAIAAALRPVARELRIAKQPRIRVFPEAFHLYTPISGVLRGRLSALELAGILHPTPAVCGVPTARAREILARQEADRGWYAGCVGWIDARGDGEFAVALRSALIERKRIVGWAGAGIVAGSDPEAEFAETEDKLSALFTVLQS